jgi:hypothetical protein
MKQGINEPLIKQNESTNGRFSSGPSELANQASGRFSSEPENQEGGRFSSGPTLPKPVAGNDSSGWFRSHVVVDIPRQPIVRRRPCFLYLLYLLAVMLATFFLYAVVFTILSILRVR